MNLAIAEEGLKIKNGVGTKFVEMIEEGLMADNVICRAYKLALASGWAVQSTLLAIEGAVIDKNDGILAENFKELFKNLGYTCNPGMISTDEAILKLIIEKECRNTSYYDFQSDCGKPIIFKIF